MNFKRTHEKSQKQQVILKSHCRNLVALDLLQGVKAKLLCETSFKIFKNWKLKDFPWKLRVELISAHSHLTLSATLHGLTPLSSQLTFKSSHSHLLPLSDHLTLILSHSEIIPLSPQLTLRSTQVVVMVVVVVVVVVIVVVVVVVVLTSECL